MSNVPPEASVVRKRPAKPYAQLYGETMKSLREMGLFGTVGALSWLGRLSKTIDDDAQLLWLAGIAISRMELRTYQAEPERTSLLVDGKVVREYIFSLKVDGP